MSGLPTDIILDILLLAKVTVEHRDIVDNTSDKQKKTSVPFEAARTNKKAFSWRNAYNSKISDGRNG